MIDNWTNLSHNILRCSKCPEIVNDRKQIVRGIGNTKAKILIIGLAPGRNGADLTGIPFTRDPSGILLSQMLTSAGLSKERDVFITNLVKCNSKDKYGRNRPPNQKEINNCHLFLQEEIELLKPKLIIPLGAAAAQTVLAKTIGSMTAIHGVPIYQAGRIIVPFIHPGYVIRGAYNRKEYIKDFSRIGDVYHQILKQEAELSRLDLLLMILYKGNNLTTTIFGKTKLQKLTFFVQDYLKKVGFNPRYAFRPYHYGPYSREIYTDLSWLESKGLININDLYNERTGLISSYEITDCGIENLEQIIESNEYYNNIYELVRRIVDEHINMNVAEIVDYAHRKYPEYDKTQIESKKDIKLTSLDSYFRT